MLLSTVVRLTASTVLIHKHCHQKVYGNVLLQKNCIELLARTISISELLEVELPSVVVNLYCQA